MFRRRLKRHLFLDAWARRSVTSDMWSLRKNIYLLTYLLSYGLPHHVTSAQSLPVFCSRLKTVVRRSFPWLFCCAREVTLVIVDTLISFLLTYLLIGSQCWKSNLPVVRGVDRNLCLWVGPKQTYLIYWSLWLKRWTSMIGLYFKTSSSDLWKSHFTPVIARGSGPIDPSLLVSYAAGGRRGQRRPWVGNNYTSPVPRPIYRKPCDRESWLLLFVNKKSQTAIFISPWPCMVLPKQRKEPNWRSAGEVAYRFAVIGGRCRADYCHHQIVVRHIVSTRQTSIDQHHSSDDSFSRSSPLPFTYAHWRSVAWQRRALEVADHVFWWRHVCFNWSRAHTTPLDVENSLKCLCHSSTAPRDRSSASTLGAVHRARVSEWVLSSEKNVGYVFKYANKPT